MIQLNDLEKSIPKSIDDIITKNRDKVQLSIVPPKEVSEIPLDGETVIIRDHITHANIFKTTIKSGDESKSMYRLLGYAENARCVWITSTIEGISNNLVRTHNSTYTADFTEDLPDMHELIHVGVYLSNMGLGDHLGITPFFY